MSNYPTREFFGKAVYISTGDYTTDNVGVGVGQLSRIHDVGWSVSYPVEEETYLNSANESFLSAPSYVNTTLKWFHTNGRNETLMGLYNQNPSGVSFLNLESEKDIYIAVENNPGIDAVGATGYNQTQTVIGMAQGVLSHYTLNASVGSIIRSEAMFECLTSFVYSGQSGNQIPAINYTDGSQVTGVFSLPPVSVQYTAPNPAGYLSTGSSNYVSALAYDELIMTFPNATPFGVTLTGDQSCYLQSFNCSIGIDRFPMKTMGYTYPSARPIVYPIHIELSAEAIVSSYQADQLQRISCLGTGNWINIIVKQPCSNATLFGLYFTGLQLMSQEFVNTIGNRDVVSFQWKGIISNPYQVFFGPTINYLTGEAGW